MTHLRAAAVMAALLLATTACSGGLLPDGEPSLVGGWVMLDQYAPDEGRTSVYLTFERDGTYLVERRFNGFSAGFPPRCRGDYRQDGGKLMLRTVVCFDQLTPVYVSEPEWVDCGAVRVRGHHLTLTGFGPEPRTVVYRRGEVLQFD